MTENLEIGEEVEYGPLNIERIGKYSYRVEHVVQEESVEMRKDEIQKLSQLAGFIGREKSDVDAW